MARAAVVGGAGLVLGFVGGLAVAPLLRPTAPATNPSRLGEASAPGGTVAESRALDLDRRGPAGQEAARLALAAASLGKAAAAIPAPPANAEVPVRLVDLPIPVQAVLAQVAQGRELRNLTLQRKVRNGRLQLETEFEIDAIDHELTLDEKGTILESEVDFAAAELPDTITSGIQTAFPGAVILDGERQQEQGKAAYFEVDVRRDGRRHQVKLSEEGRVLEDRPR